MTAARPTDSTRSPAESAPTDPVAPPSLADRFLSELQRRRAETPRALPMQFRPLAREVAGDRPVRVATGPASRQALAAVGKVAATAGDTVHLARTPDSSPGSVEVLAHEMTHVAHPSPSPRFFDDDHDTDEERRADVIGRIMATSPGVGSGPLPTSTHAAVVSRSLAPTRTIGTAHLPVGTPMQMLNASPAASPPQVQRKGSATQSQSSASGLGTVSADEMIRRLTEPSTATDHDLGSTSSRSSASPTTAGDASSTTIQRENMTDATSSSGDFESDYSTDESALGQLFEDMTSSDYYDFVDAVVDALERRILNELDRRGGRFRRGI